MSHLTASDCWLALLKWVGGLQFDEFLATLAIHPHNWLLLETRLAFFLLFLSTISQPIFLLFALVFYGFLLPVLRLTVKYFIIDLQQLVIDKGV